MAGLTQYKPGSEIFWLTDFIDSIDNKKVLDLGCGRGDLLALLDSKFKGLDMWGIEIQRDMVFEARKNFQSIVEGDLVSIEKYFNPKIFDVVVCNPPFFKLGSGRMSLILEKAYSKHEILCSMKDVIFAAKYVLSENGLFYVMYPKNRFGEFLIAIRNHFTLIRCKFFESKNPKYFIAKCLSL